jgi:epoxide hydrolase-like predicted phosphatase
MSSEILRIVKSVKSGKSSAHAEVEAAISRAEADKTNAILEIVRERALKRADEIDQKIVAGKDAGRLAGVPFIAKDNFLTLGSKTTAASKMLENFEAPLQATAIERLEAEGAICIGKSNLDSFAHGGSTENSAFGVTKNAVDETRVAGGSSGGSAVVVARGIVPFALGSDTGGSIRQPASFNGVIGYKPTYGMISRYGVVAMASSTDVVGPIARSVEDVELLCKILAGPDGRDGTVFPNYFSKRRIKAIITDCFGVLSTGILDYLDELYPKHHNEIFEMHKPFDKGEGTFQQFVKTYADAVGSNQEDMLQKIQGARSKAKRNEKFLSSIENWKKNYKIGLLSNVTPGLFEIYFTPEEKKYFDDVVLSFQEKLVKPDPKIYELAARRLGVKPEECIFVDDSQANVDAATALGMLGVLFDDTEKVIKDIDRILSQSQDETVGVSRKLKIGLTKEFIGDGVDQSVIDRTHEFAAKLEKLGHTVEEVGLPMAKYALPIYYIVTPAELSSNLARYDGVRYGLRAADAKTLAEVYGRSRDQGFVDENKRRIMIGSYVLSSGYFDAYYLQAQKARTLLIREFDKLFEEYDFLIGPVAPTPAFKIGENIADPLKMYMADIMTAPASLAGLPALSLPAGIDKNGLPIGVQIIGRMKDDGALLGFARSVEGAKND